MSWSGWFELKIPRKMAVPVRVCGVPEHFNLPWLMALEEGAFDDRGIELEWTDVPEGTGKMCELLQDAETDLAVILTEGAIKAISEGLPAGIVQGYVGVVRDRLKPVPDTTSA